jgi:hypothetical protein
MELLALHLKEIMKMGKSRQHNGNSRATVKRQGFPLSKFQRFALVRDCKGGRSVIGGQRRFEAGDSAGREGLPG